MIISIEGIDGAGKTTLAERLKMNNNAKIIKAPRVGFLDQTRRFVDEHKNETVARTIYYLASVKHILDVNFINTLDKNNDNVIFDRYFRGVFVTQTEFLFV